MATAKKDHVELFHDYGIYIPARIINLETSHSEDGDDDGVSHYMATKFMKNFICLESLNKDPITVILNTVGGSCSDGMAIYDLINNSKCHTIVRVIGQASSMGSWILQAGKERLVAPSSTVMFHAGTGGVGSYNPYEVANSAEFDKKYMENMYKIIFDRINEKREKDEMALMSWKTFENIMLKGRYLTAEEAVAIGLADRIG